MSKWNDYTKEKISTFKQKKKITLSKMWESWSELFTPFSQSFYETLLHTKLASED